MGPLWTGVALSPATGVLAKDRREETQTQRRRPCEGGGEIGVMGLQAKAVWGLLGTSRSQEKGVEGLLPQNRQMETILWLLASRAVKRINFSLF